VSNLYDAMSLNVAEAIARQLKIKPDSNFGLPTGRSPVGCYQILSGLSQEGALDWSRTKCFALDDYLDVDEEQSFHYFLESNLYRQTNLPQQNRFSPKYQDNYDQLIADQGGLDLCVLGLGTNGHIAFNEPGTPQLSWTHCHWLTQSTREANASAFGSVDKVPTRAITIGIETILASKSIILIASGEKKKTALTKALSGEITGQVPASFLALHPQVKVFRDFEM
jgi:glucosamine-6-phosphate deaminase